MNTTKGCKRHAGHKKRCHKLNVNITASIIVHKNAKHQHSLKSNNSDKMLQSTKEGQNVRIGITQLMTDSVVIIPCASLNNVTTHLDRIKDEKLNHSI